MQALKILLLSAYDAQSHRYWHQQLATQFPQHAWQILSLKDRYFAWRMGGNALSFKAQFDAQLKADYDVVIATSMTDLSTLLGLYPHLAKRPKQLYFHENQFAYPVNQQQQGLLEIQLRSIYSALVADCLWFNSSYNRDSFLTGVKRLTKKMPDGIPGDLNQSLHNKSKLLPVPIADDCQPLHRNHPCKTHIEVVWNHRWEHDKGPETLLEVLRLCMAHPEIKFHIIGQQFRLTPPAMQQIIAQHASQCLTLGYIESRTQYIQTLQQADVVLSTAHHDFQGIAMLEAVACGCIPIAPQRLVYPALYPRNHLYPSTPENPQQEAQAIVAILQQPEKLNPVAINCSWPQLQSRYADFLQ